MADATIEDSLRRIMENARNKGGSMRITVQVGEYFITGSYAPEITPPSDKRLIIQDAVIFAPGKPTLIIESWEIRIDAIVGLSLDDISPVPFTADEV